VANYPPFNAPFTEQLAFFRKKLNLPTEAWDDIERMAHDRAFIVAGAQGADLLEDLRGAVDGAIENGTGLGQFRKDFKRIVAERGWTGWTGEGTKGGEAWRTKVIYQTNMATSYAAGRWKQLNDPELLKILPYWQYHHNDSVMTPRPLHVSWDGLTLPPTHPFWQTHFPPNGWGCMCWVTAVTKEKFMLAVANGKGPANAPTTTEGIDKGFDYAPGANADTSLRQFVQDKLIKYPPAITKALSRDVNRYVNASQDAATFAREVLADHARTDQLWLGFVENFAQVMETTQVDAKGYMVMLPADAPRHAETVHGHDGGAQRPPVPNDYQNIWSVLAESDRMKLSGETSMHGNQMIIAWKQIGNEQYRCVFEVRPGKNNRALALWSMVIKLVEAGGG
jgi:hypothetical protein